MRFSCLIKTILGVVLGTPSLFSLLFLGHGCILVLYRTVGLGKDILVAIPVMRPRPGMISTYRCTRERMVESI